VLDVDVRWPLHQLPLQPGFVLIAVTAASLNYAGEVLAGSLHCVHCPQAYHCSRAGSVAHADPLTIQGKYQVKLKPPFVPGSEASGVIVAVGPRVRGLAAGDHVVAFSQGGMFAAHVVVHSATVWKVPGGMLQADVLCVCLCPCVF
jgi:NADPH:quinone reductase-like Zn-dependent oxidoreductase